MKKCYAIFTLSAVTLACSSAIMAAQPINLSKLSADVLKNLSTKTVTYKEVRQHADFNGTSQLRVQQTYHGYPVWNGDAVYHVPHTQHASLGDLNDQTTANGTALSRFITRS